MNLNDVKKFLADNKEDESVQEFLNSLQAEQQPDLDTFKQLIEQDDNFRSFMDSQKDKHYAKALETWKENNLPELVDNKVRELYPEDDPKDIKVSQLERKVEELENARQREKMTNLALKKAEKLNLPTELINYFVTTNEEETLENLNKFSEVYTTDFQTKLREKLKGQGDQIPASNQMGSLPDKNLAEMSYSERNKLYNENKELYDQLTKQNNKGDN